VFFVVNSHAHVPVQLGKSSVEEVISAMTLTEKVKLVRGTGMAFATGGPQVGMTKDKVHGAAGTSFAIPRLGIPSIVFADGPAGVRISPTRDDDKINSYHATAFPIATLLGSSWNVSIMEAMGKAVGEEAKEYGIDVLLAPALNIHRHAMGGRNFEYYSEDPLISGEMAAAYVNGVQEKGVGTTLKHFVANNHEWNRDKIDVELDQKTFREIYLRGFEIATKESKPWAVMSSYNKVNGEYTSESEFILTEILRKQWGFDGIVMTDWFGGESAVKQMQAGNDLLMPGADHQNPQIIAAIKSGQLDESILDRNVTNILTVILKSQAFKQYPYSNKPDLKAHAALAKEVALEGIVLLKNNHKSLPVKSDVSIALLGNSSYETAIGGTGSGDVNEAYSVSIEQGLLSAGLTLNNSLTTAYKQHIKIEKENQPISHHPLADMMPKAALKEYEITADKAEQLAKKHDIAVITLGRNSGEFVDRERQDFYLTKEENNLINVVSNAFNDAGKSLVVVLNVGGVIETTNWQDKADAILLTHLSGQEAGNAITDIILGKTTPSGKLASTWPVALEDYPADKGFPGFIIDEKSEANSITGSRPSKVVYHEGVLTGYRHFDTKAQAVAYPFGFGLSYTDFSYQNVTLSDISFNETLATGITVELTVKNTGAVAGKEVVQLYISAPNNGTNKAENGHETKPKKELRGFVKTRLLAPGESENISFKIDANSLSSFNIDKNSWVAEAGKYTVHLAESSNKVHSSQSFILKSSLSKKL